MVGKSMYALKTRSFLLWIFLFALILWTCTYYSLTVIKEYSSERHSFIMPVCQNSGYLIKTSSCRIPEMYVNSPDINSHMSYNDELNCKSKWNYSLSLVTSNLTALILNASALATLNIDVDDPLFGCQYSAIENPLVQGAETKRRPYKYRNKNNYGIGKETYFRRSVTVPDEMVEVICTFDENVIYIDYHVFVRPTRAVKRRADGDVNVLVLGLDGVSRVNFHRHMPKTSAFLSQLGNVEMMGYNKVEDNTFPNLIPVLTGLSVDELRKRCWHRDEDYFDGCHFVWDDYKTGNFQTAFVEDSPMLGLFNYLKSGFRGKPVDHYFRPLMIRAEERIGHERRDNIVCCTGSRLAMTALFGYARRIASAMAGRAYMGFFWSSSLTHDYVEYPRFGDDDLRAFFQRINGSGELNNTVLVLMSDHGIRWGSYRDTYQGGLEDRLPMLRFIVPEWFRNAYPRAVRNLNGNTVRLTTPYDLHETLSDLVDASRLVSDGTIDARTEANAAGNGVGRGASLFLEIPENRTCQSAGIPRHFCACRETRTALAVNDAQVVKAAGFLTDVVNKKLSAYPSCAELSLYEIHSAAVETVGSASDYEIRVTAVPGYAKFEATVRRDGEWFEILGSISRLNTYRDQSVCVNDAVIKLFCYCVQKTN